MATVASKRDMYAMLAAGKFGNTIPQYFSVDSWLASPGSQKFPLWGVRSATVSAHPACRLNCPREEVAEYAAKHFASGPSISMMIDRFCTVTGWFEVWDGPGGLIVEGVQFPDIENGWTWRNSMPDPTKRKRWEGVFARQILLAHLNDNSYDDLGIVLERYPGHVVELSATDRCFGTVPHRNSIVWEVRNY